MTSMRLVVLRTGDVEESVAAECGQFASWIRREVGSLWQGAWHEHDVRTDAPLPSPRDADGFIVTGSPSSVTAQTPWMLRAQALLEQIAGSGVPLFGICFGHQMVGQALGGRVAPNPRGREIGTRLIRVVDGAGADPLLAGLERTEFFANCTHVDSLVALPPGAQLLAETDLEPHAAFAVGKNVRCVQFHPEMNGEAMRGYIRARASAIASEGGDPSVLVQDARDAPQGSLLLKNFVRAFVAT